MKLLDMVGGAIGTAYEPRHIRKMADATAYEISVIGEAMRNTADMPVMYNQEGVAINSEDFSRLMQRAGTRLALQETIKQHNIESVVDNAYEILEKEDIDEKTLVLTMTNAQKSKVIEEYEGKDVFPFNLTTVFLIKRARST